jgi:hypothetical protein
MPTATPRPEVAYDPTQRVITVHPGDHANLTGRLCRAKVPDVGRRAVFLRQADLESFGVPSGLLATVRHEYPTKGVDTTLPTVQVIQYGAQEPNVDGVPLTYSGCAFSVDKLMREKLGLPPELPEDDNSAERFDHGTITIALSDRRVGTIVKSRAVESGLLAASDQAGLQDNPGLAVHQAYNGTAAIYSTALADCHDGAACYQIAYDRTTPDWAVWSIDFEATDVSGLGKLAFNIRGNLGGERPNVYLVSPGDPDEVRYYADVEDFALVSSTAWQRVAIPLSSFEPYEGETRPLDRAQIIRVQLAFEWEPTTGIVFVDRFAFESE